MFTFTIAHGEILQTAGTPDFVFLLKDFDKFKENISLFEQKFPDKLFGCADDISETYQLNDETKVPLNELETADIGVYFGIKTKSEDFA